MRKVQLAATALGAAILVFGVANAGPSGGMGGGMQGTPNSGMTGQPLGANSMSGQNATTDTCGDNAATRIPCSTHKANAKAKTKGAASADVSGANANAKTKAKAKTKTDPYAAGAPADTSSSSSATTPPDSPH